MFSGIIIVTVYICHLYIYGFLRGPMADERTPNGSPSIIKDYYYHFIKTADDLDLNVTDTRHTFI